MTDDCNKADVSKRERHRGCDYCPCSMACRDIERTLEMPCVKIYTFRCPLVKP